MGYIKRKDGTNVANYAAAVIKCKFDTFIKCLAESAIHLYTFIYVSLAEAEFISHLVY